MSSRFFTDIAYRGVNYDGEKICGDNFISRTMSGGRRTVAILSDGLDHGVKANILSNYTATMLANFLSFHEEITGIAEKILRMLPVCSVRKISYSTFTIADIDNETGEVFLAEHDNPRAFLLREGFPVALERETRRIAREDGRDLTLHTYRFTAGEGDRLVFVSDGITQSGQRSGLYRFGWGEDALLQFASYTASVNSGIGSGDLASQILSKGVMNDNGHPGDDMSCVAIGFRRPRELMFISCPPSVKALNASLVTRVRGFSGDKVICGFPVATIIADGLCLPLIRNDRGTDPLTVPLYTIPGFKMVTEGIVVPSRVLDLLETHPTEVAGNGVAEKLCRMFLNADIVTMVIGMRKNIDSAGALPDEFELRRNILKRISTILRKKYSKKLEIIYI